MRVRIGNDFVFLWSIERNGKPENLSECLEIKLTLKAFEMEKEIDFEIVDDNIIRIEVTPEMTTVMGHYSLVLRYTLADESFSDNDRKCAVDTKAFTIVANTAVADDISEIAVTSDMLIGLKGDPFTYDDFTPEMLEAIYQPAIDASLSIQAVEEVVEQAELSRVGAEIDRVNKDTQRDSSENQRAANEAVRIENENTRKANEQTRQSNESARVTAEIDRESNEDTRSLSEAARLTNEDDRIANENQRVIDEGKREQLYDNTVILKGEVETLKTETETAKDNAITATEKSENISSHPNKIINDYWYKWNYQTQEYENTGIEAKGDKGDMPNIIMNINEQGHLIATITNK